VPHRLLASANPRAASASPFSNAAKRTLAAELADNAEKNAPSESLSNQPKLTLAAALLENASPWSRSIIAG